ncbi:MAG: secondary thiamine-phosphate synthase enzyme YjbQ [Candidatus Woesearchaeota archaeon]
MKTISIKTNRKMQIVDVTEKIKENITIKNGLVHIKSLHTTAGLFINEGYDNYLKKDFINYFKSLPTINFKHAEGNSKAHIFSTMIGNECILDVEDNKLDLGRWQKILLFEFDGPRSRRITIKEISKI